MAGKGDTPRPVDKEKYESNYEKIFRNNDTRRNNPRITKQSRRSK